MPVRLGLVALTALVLVLAAPTTALAKRPVPPATPTTYDVSYPQCGSALPVNAAGGVVGVNHGIVFSANPCLAAEWSWAARATRYAPSLYANTGNPGPAYSSHWPTGATPPRACNGGNTFDCSYDYGWNAAKDSFADAAASVANPAAYTWWLDVETGNSWETLESAYGQTAASRSNDVAALQGEADALADSGVVTVGFYSTSYQWSQITGGTSATFAAHPAWIAGTGSLSTAQSHCTTTSFTAGPIVLTQYAANGYDADYHC